MKYILGVLISFILLSCSNNEDSDIETPSDEIGNNGVDINEDEGLVDDNAVDVEQKLLKKITLEDGSFTELIYDENEELIESVNNKGLLSSRLTYNSEGLAEKTENFNYDNESSELREHRSTYYEYDDRERIVIEKEIDILHYIDPEFTYENSNTINYEGTKVTKVYGVNSSSSGYTEYSINEEDKIEKSKAFRSDEIIMDLEFFYDENNSCISVKGSAQDSNGQTGLVEATMSYYPILKKRNTDSKFSRQFLISQLPGFRIFILNFSGSNSDYYLKTVDWTLSWNNNPVSITYDYEFDADNYPVSLKEISKSNDGTSEYSLFYEWE